MLSNLLLRYCTLAIFFAIFSNTAFAQGQKVLDHTEFAIWKRVTQTKISNNGDWIVYQLSPGEGDPSVHAYQVATGKTLSFERASKPSFTADNKFMIFQVSATEDSIKALKRKKVEKDDLPGDSLCILNLERNLILKIPALQKFSVPEEWSGYIVYQLTQFADEQDTTRENSKKAIKGSGKKGYPLLIRNLNSGQEDTIPYVKDYQVSKKAPQIMVYSTGRDSTFHAGVYNFNCGQSKLQPLALQKGTYKKLAISEDGMQMSFLGDQDTTDARVRPYGLFYFKTGMDSARIVAHQQSPFLQKDWLISENASTRFSENGKYLYFGTAPEPILEDTTLLPDEKVNVEVWHYEDPVLYTQQNVRADDERKRTYLAVYNTEQGVTRQLANSDRKESTRDRDANSPYIITYSGDAYQKESSWTGDSYRDLYLTDVKSGTSLLIGKKIEGSARFSPSFKFVYWYNAPDTSWFAYDVNRKTTREITPTIKHLVFDELNDRPMYPNDYGSAGWLKDDDAILIYDRYDIWSVDPTGVKSPRNLTKGRSGKTTYRYASLDPDERFIDPNQSLLLHTFDHNDKSSGYTSLRISSGQMKTLIKEPFAFSRRPQKAKEGSTVTFTKESFSTFPDIMLTKDMFQSSKKVSDANPQQKDYRWGTIELFNWTAYDGQKLNGLLVKPAGFDPSKKYPMIVNFYERSSDGLHTHRYPAPHRSTINYSFYASRGYLIFNPDVFYKTGYPGQGAYNSAVSGTEALIKEGFVDQERIALQGHSWGGYQIAHILTKTDLYKCAESGAPVVNMISAYGGIRWGSGMSRMFQYEHTQSRIGATLWEKPELYIENSPIFNIDKINTPVLILHNDEDSAVPWYQGIEFFVAMRRLGKPAWMLNYNGEPHWPVKLQNRKDFNIRMQQFFDHYLQDAPMPSWMKRGVPAIEKGILQGYELMEQDKN